MMRRLSSHSHASNTKHPGALPHALLWAVCCTLPMKAGARPEGKAHLLRALGLVCVSIPTAVQGNTVESLTRA